MTDEKRSYKKRSDYWQKFHKDTLPIDAIAFAKTADFQPEMIGESYYESQASSERLSSPTNRTSSRDNLSAKVPAANRFKNISEGLLPYEYSTDSVCARDAVELCQKAYFNVAGFRSTLDMLAEFADSDLYLEGGTEKSKKFVKAWWKRIKMHDLKAQYFREWYRSGNVFFYRLEGKLKNQASKIIESYGALNTRTTIPIKYLLLNPVDIAAKGCVSFSDFQYFKVLTPFEIARLRNPKTDYEKELRDSLPADVQARIKTGVVSTADRLFLQLDADLLHAIFCKKQDYEPMAIPMGFAVLDDINKKMELKKIDQAIARSIENVVLLVTMGAKPEEGGINHRNLAAMQEIFKNQSVGRVLVSDYTTKAEFVIPDLKKVMGKEKYEVLNKDIEEGLQNVLMGESKYADTKLKLKIFMQRLNEARDMFLQEFLQPEIKRLCKAMEMRSWPVAKFVKTDTLDDEGLQRLVTRMMELGILTPEQGIKTINSGVFPNEDELASAQQEFVDQRKEGYYTPLINTINLQQQEIDKDQQEFDNDLSLEQQKMAEEQQKQAAENAKKQQEIAKKAASQPVIKTAAPALSKQPSKKTATSAGPSGGRPMGTSKAEYSKKNIVEATKLINEFELKAFSAFALKHGVEKLEADKEGLVSRVCESIVVAKEKDEWDNTLSEVVADFDKIGDLEISPQVLDVGARHQLDDLSAAILYHSTKISV